VNLKMRCLLSNMFTACKNIQLMTESNKLMVYNYD